MTRFRTGPGLAAIGLLAPAAIGLLALAPRAAAYDDQEARAIVATRPTALPPGTEQIVIATQKTLEVSGPGELVAIDHILWMVGPAGPRDQGRMRWSHRIGMERIWLVDGWIHRKAGAREPIPADSVRTVPCIDAGPKGYPGIADFVVTPPTLHPGDVVEVKVQGVIAPFLLQKHYAGEHHFGGPDSTIESELVFTFSNRNPLRTWWFGAVPPAEERTAGGVTVARWLLGHLPPEPAWERTIASCVTPLSPRTGGPPVLRYGFPDDWESIAQSRRGAWRALLRKMPDELTTISRTIQNEHADPSERTDAVLAWVDQRLLPLEIPAARMWFEPADIEEVLGRGAAIPRDRAAILVWLLRSVGVAAEAATVCGGEPLQEDLPLPQQMDSWVVMARPTSTGERWLDMRSGDARLTPLPPGKALVWSTEPGEPILLPFPGIEPQAPH